MDKAIHTGKPAARPVSIAELLSKGKLLYVPGAWDGLSARVAQQAGYPALFSSGMAIAASFGMPDADIYTMSENLAAVRRIREAAPLPLIADLDHGYGGPLNVQRAVRLFEQAGATAVIIEDQASPKRCPICVDDPVALAPVADAAARIRAACDARVDPETMIVARTDASGAEAISRAEAYAKAGADMIFPVSKTFATTGQWADCHRAVGLPLLACLTSGTWVERDFDRATMEQIGVRVALLPFHALYAAIAAMRRALDRMQAGDAPAAVSADGLSHEEFRAFIDFDAIMAREAQYAR
jgi:methylisocitrate lyase